MAVGLGGFLGAGGFVGTIAHLTLPSSEHLSELLRVVARRYPQVMEEPSVKTLIENLEEAALQPETMKEMFGESRKRK